MSAVRGTKLLPREHYLNVDYGVRSWLLTTDHKRIALLYLASITLFFFLGGFFAVLIRLELLTPAGDLVQPETYNKLFTMHGVVMVFFFLIPAVPAVLGNFLVPMMIGARDLAFPKLNLLSWYVYTAGGLFTLTVVVTGGVDTGWTFYTPYSSTYANSHVILTALGVFITGFSSILTGLNFIVTIHKMRAPGLTWFRLPLFIWAHYATSLIMILGTPVIAVTIVLVALERLFRFGIFDPALGGDPLLFQHLFWFYSHPAVYIMVLPSMGVVNELPFSSNRDTTEWRIQPGPITVKTAMPARDELTSAVRAGTGSLDPRDDRRHLQLSNEVWLDGVTLKRFLLDVSTLTAPEADDKLTRGTTLTTRQLHRDAQGELACLLSRNRCLGEARPEAGGVSGSRLLAEIGG